jgi:hypothetical protein
MLYSRFSFIWLSEKVVKLEEAALSTIEAKMVALEPVANRPGARLAV